jgi:hypothetical protein
MLYVFTGSDTVTAKAEAKKLAQKAEMIIFGEGGEAFEQVPSYLVSRGLFTPEIALLIDRPLESVEGKALIGEYGDALQKATMPVWVITGPLTMADKKLFPKGAEFREYAPKEKKTYERPNVFGFTDAFLAGDKKKTWIGYQKLIREGVSAEEIHGALSWAVRGAFISLKTSSSSEAGLKPFVYTKSKRAGERLGEEKVAHYSRELVSVYHNARSGVGTMEQNLELFLLKS